MHRPVSMTTSVATGIKGVCHCCMFCKAGQCDFFFFYFSDLQENFIHLDTNEMPLQCPPAYSAILEGCGTLRKLDRA